VRASHRRTVLSSDSLARNAQLALKATHVTLFSWPAGAVRAIIMGILLCVGANLGSSTSWQDFCQISYDLMMAVTIRRITREKVMKVTELLGILGKLG
jgi:hypothetical protein